MPIIQQKQKQTKPMRTIMLSFLVIIFIGTVILMLPISSRDGRFTPLIDSFFTATSAACVNGLVVYDTYAHWNLFGQIVILIMIQIGGLGLLTFTSFFNFAVGKKLGLRSMQLASESVNSGGFNNIRDLIRDIMKISLICEGTGAILFMMAFVPKYGVQGIFMSIFLAVSAFCNAGFDVFGFLGEYSSITPFADNPIVVSTVMLLVICGGLGFVVWQDLIQYRKTKKLILHTKIVLIVSACLIVIGAMLVTALEWNNPETLGELSPIQKITRGLFHSVTFRTAGFNTINLGSMYSITKIFAIILMFIGGAPCSTAGGLKVTTFAVIIMTVFCVILNKEDTEIMGRKIDKDAVYKSLAISVLSVLAIFATALTLFYANAGINGLDSLFEAVSAFSTAGASVGPTAMANGFSRIILTVSMFMGRVGPVSLALSLTINSANRAKNQIIPEGKIIVG